MGKGNVDEYMKEHPIFSTQTLLSSICDLIVETTGITDVYISPINAGQSLPRFFVFIRGEVDTDKETNDTGYKFIPIDIVYEQNFNLPNLYDNYMEMADKISEAVYKNLKYNVRDKQSPYDILVSIPLDAHEIKTTYDQDAMHCKFNLRLRIIDADIFDKNYIKTVDWEVYSKVDEDEKQ